MKQAFLILQTLLKIFPRTPYSAFPYPGVGTPQVEDRCANQYVKI